MCNSNDFPNNEKLEKISNLLLNFNLDTVIATTDTFGFDTELVSNSLLFRNDVFKQLGLLFHDMRRGINRASLITDFIVTITKLADHYNKACEEYERNKLLSVEARA